MGYPQLLHLHLELGPSFHGVQFFKSQVYRLAKLLNSKGIESQLQPMYKFLLLFIIRLLIPLTLHSNQPLEPPHNRLITDLPTVVLLLSGTEGPPLLRTPTGLALLDVEGVERGLSWQNFFYFF